MSNPFRSQVGIGLKGLTSDSESVPLQVTEEGHLIVTSGISVITDPVSGNPVNLDEDPLVVTLNDGTERVIPTDGLRGRQLVITAVGDAAITVTQQVVKDGPFLFAHVVTAASSDDDRTTTVGTTHGGNVYAIKLQRTTGTNTTSTGRLG